MLRFSDNVWKSEKKKKNPLNYSLYSYSELEDHRHVEQLCFGLKKDFSGRRETWGRCHFCWIFHLAQQKVGRRQQLLADIGEEVCDLCRAGKQLQAALIYCTDILVLKLILRLLSILLPSYKKTVRSNRSDPQKWLGYHQLLPLSTVWSGCCVEFGSSSQLSRLKTFLWGSSDW